MIRGWDEGDPQGHAQAGMVLGPFAKTKGPRRAGPKPRSNKNDLTKYPRCPPTTAGMTAYRKKGIFFFTPPRQHRFSSRSLRILMLRVSNVEKNFDQ